MKKRIICALIVFALCINILPTSLTVQATATVSEITGLSIDRLIEVKPFTGDIADDSKWWLDKVQDGSVEFEDGKLKITGESNSNSGEETIARYYINGKDGTGETGLTVFEFDVERSGGGSTNFYINSMANTSGFNGGWNADGKFYGRVGETNTLACTTASTEKMNFAVLLDVENNKYSLWIDGKLVLEEKQMRGEPSDIGYINIYPSKNYDQTLYISNFRIYETYPAASVCLARDKELLNLKSEVTESFTLPSKGGRYQSNITWSAPTSDYLSISGYNCSVTRPDDENKTVTLTATIEHKGETVTKDILVTVIRDLNAQERVDLDYAWLTTELDTLGENSSAHEVTTELAFLNEGKYGSSITWVSENTDVIANDGKVIRPKRGEGVEVTVTATVSLPGATSKTEEFTYKVLPIGLPEIDRLIAEESFTGDIEGNAKWNLEKVQDGSVEFDNGKLKITGESNSNSGEETIARYYINGKDGAGETGLTVFEFDVERSGGGSTNFYINSMANTSGFNGGWNADGKFYGRVGETNTLACTTASTEKMNFAVLLDVENNKYSLWIDGKLVLEEKQMRGEPSDIGYINIYPSKNADQILYISNFKVYETYPAAEVCVTKDAEKIVLPSVVTESFTLPSAGERYQSNITWSAPTSDYISISGNSCTVTRPDGENAVVTLTATIEKDGKTTTKPFTLTVLRSLDAQGIVDEDYAHLTEEATLGENSSKDEVVAELSFPETGQYGSHITWESGNTAVITNDGKVIRPKRGEDVEVTVTVTVSLPGAVSKTRTFTYKVSSMGLPAIKRIIAQEEFAGDIEDNTKWYLAKVEDGTVTYEDGKLKIAGVNNGDGKGTVARYYINGIDGEGETGLTVVEFDAERIGTGTSNFYINSMANISGFNGGWNADGKIYGRVGDENKYSGYSTKSTEKMSFTALLDIEKQIYSLWIDGELVFEDAQMRGTPADVGYINMYPSTNYDQTLYISNFIVYEPQLTPQEIVERDSDRLSLEILITAPNPIDSELIDENLSLPLTGKDGSTISWVSSDTTVITNGGEVIRPQQTENVTVNLTATITYENAETDESAETEKVIPVTVLALPPGGDAGILQADYNWLTETVITPQAASSVTKDLNFHKEGLYGSAIEWGSTEPDVINERGWVYRPREGEKVTADITATLSYAAETPMDKPFAFTVLPVELPIIKEIIAQDDFEGDIIDEKWTLEIEDGAITQEDGRLKIMGTSASGGTTARYYFNENGTYMSGVIAAEFYLEKEGKGSALFYGFGNGGGYFSGRWEEDGDVSIHYRESEGAESDFHTVTNIHPTNRMHVVILFDTVFATYSLWINGDEFVMTDVLGRDAITNIRNINIYPSASDDMTLYVDRMKVYYTNPMDSADAVERDWQWLTTNILTQGKESSYAPDFIDDDLYLPTTGQFLSEISWYSSDESLVALDGTVNRPGNEAGEDPQVTLKATLKVTLEDGTEIEKEKEFTYRVLRNLTNSAQIVDAEYNYLDYSVLSDKGSYKDILQENEVISSIWFMSKGPHGGDIAWTTSDTSAVTNSGRVIRPKIGEDDKTVNVTATIISGDVTRTKDFIFIVKADERFTDPQHMSDEEFFGVWNGNSWTTAPGLNYSATEGMAAVETAVKTVANGDYTVAKEALLAYYRGKKTANADNTVTIELSDRSTGWANMAVDGWLTTQSDVWYQGEFTANKDWKTISADIRTKNITAGSTNSFEIASWYNEASMLELVSNNHSDETLRPKIELTVNGSQKTFYATADATLRAGSYSGKNFGTEDVNKVMTYGKFLGNETYHTVLKFDFSSLSATDVIEDAKMVLYCRVTPQFAGEKKLIILRSDATAWAEDTITWNTVSRQTYSYNGLADGHDWAIPEGGIAEGRHQAVRFPTLPPVAVEYLLTNNEDYMYKYLRILEDFIKDCGAWYPEGHPEARGGYYRTLDVSSRVDNWVSVIDTLMDSESMNAETATAILKAMHDMTNSLYYVHSTSGNWWSNEMRTLIDFSNTFPEFTNAAAWRSLGFSELNKFFSNNVFPDGSYIEATGLYNTASTSIGSLLKQTLQKQGIDTDEEFDYKLRYTALYDLILRAPDGQSVLYGDSSANKKTSAKYQKIVNWYNDRELEYIDTFGKKGIKPEWTSILYPDSRLAAMRSSWEKNALYMFTNVRGVGQHSHAADGHITLYAYDRMLLSDAGRYKYQSSDPIRQWMQSTRAHNTVEINDVSQSLGSSPSNTTIYNVTGRGTINQWVTNDNYDFLSESTTRTKGYSHQRNITFVKPYYWIVSDIMSPTSAQNMGSSNSYKQLWHMMPDANLKIDNDGKTIRSGYGSGANIIVASADGSNVTVKKEMGYYDSGNAVAQQAPYGYFALDNVTGKATFDTVLVPVMNDANAEVNVERLNIGVSESTATAIKFEVDSKSLSSTGYYYLSYETENQPERSFDKYSTDGQLTFVSENIGGKIDNIIIQNASTVKKDGEVLVSYTDRLSDLSLQWQGNALAIETDASIDYSALKIASDASLEKLTVNGANAEFAISSGYIVFAETGVGDTPVSGESAEIVDRIPTNDSSESGGGAGGGGGGDSVEISGKEDESTEDGENTQQPTTEAAFKDIIGHWAANEIEYLYSKGIIKGKENDKFAPEDSITRAEMLALTVRVLGLSGAEYTGTFDDVLPGDWYCTVVETGLKYGLISKDKKFRPNDFVTREEMTKMITEAYKIQNELQRPDGYQINYSDEADISQWAKEYVCDADYLELINGVGEGRFAPKGNATRAQSAVIIKRLLDKISE